MDSTGNVSHPLNMTAGEDAEINQVFAETVEGLNASYSGPNQLEDAETETEISVPDEHVAVTDTNRPRNLADDSAQSVAGSRQATIGEICTLGSVNWAEAMVKMTSSNSSSTITMVSLLNQSL